VTTADLKPVELEEQALCFTYMTDFGGSSHKLVSRKPDMFYNCISTLPSLTSIKFQKQLESQERCIDSLRLVSVFQMLSAIDYRDLLCLWSTMYECTWALLDDLMDMLAGLRMNDPIHSVFHM
jgi:hypothetical protein